MMMNPVHFQENRRLEMELLDSNEKLVEAQSQITKLQTSLDNIMKDKVLRCYLMRFHNMDFLFCFHYWTIKMPTLTFFFCFSVSLFLLCNLSFCLFCIFVLICLCTSIVLISVWSSFSLVTWTLAVQTSFSKRSVLNSYAAATKPSAG